MCGILACISILPRQKKPSWFENGLKRISHRGPDGQGTWWSPTKLGGQKNHLVNMKNF